MTFFTARWTVLFAALGACGSDGTMAVDGGSSAPDGGDAGTACAWSEVEVLGGAEDGDRFAIWGSSSTDIFVVGSELLHFDGAGWDVDDTIRGSGMWGSGPNDVHVMNSDVRRHYDGNEWTSTPLLFGGVNSMWGVAPDDLMATGNMDLIRNQGNGWERITLPGDASTMVWTSVWASGADDWYLVGQPGLAMHFSGGAWSQIEIPGTAYNTGIWGSGPDDIFVIGQHATVIHFDGVSWTLMDGASDPTAVDDNFFSIWGRNANDVYAVGGAGVFHYDGNRWAQEALPIRGISGIWGSDDGHTYVSGSNGVLFEQFCEL